MHDTAQQPSPRERAGGGSSTSNLQALTQGAPGGQAALHSCLPQALCSQRPGHKRWRARFAPRHTRAAACQTVAVPPATQWPRAGAQKTLHCPSASVVRDSTGDAYLQEHATHEGPLALYKQGRLSGRYRKDPRQEQAILQLQRLWEELRAAYRDRSSRRSGLTLTEHVGETQPPKSWWRGLNKLVHGAGGSEAAAVRKARGIRGTYLYGGVGTGKTMLMDLLVASAAPSFKLRRQTFHEFMLEIHQQLFKHQHKPEPLALVADDVAARARVLCLDEFFVEDVGDATILARLFAHLWQRGLVLVATSNRGPQELYLRGLQRESFLPFIAQLEEHTHVFDIDSTIDYRKLALHQSGLYFFPGDGGGDPDSVLEAKFAELAAACHERVGPRTVPVAMGRTLRVPEASGGLCKFPFAELCGQPVAAADYAALAGNFHTLALRGVPVFTAETRAEAYRFLLLVDVLYEHTTRLVCSAAAAPPDLFAFILTREQARQPHPQVRDEDMVVDDTLGFTKERCISRLSEMETLVYLKKHAALHSPQLLLALQEADSKAQEREVLEGAA